MTRLILGAALIWTLTLTLTLAITAQAQAAEPDFADRQDFTFAERGFVGTRADPKILGDGGRVVWDLTAYDFLKGSAPASVNPSLWRQSQLLAKAGLFEVVKGVWQVRGFDAANATFIAGKTGWIVIDPLTATETAKAALELANAKLGARPVVALIYTHSHADHFGGARGMVAQADVDAGRVQVIAPAGFLEHAVSENIIAGGAMSRRAQFQFGSFVPKGPTGQVGIGIGPAVAPGTQSLIAPNVEIARTGETRTIDGVRFEFQVTPGTEAPAELNFYLPDLKLLDLAENANATMHNVLTPRGALVRDAKAWADYLSESIRLYGARTDTLMTSHGWPRFGRSVIGDYLEKHRDAYKYLHDQTVRLMNDGLTGPEIANRIRLPEALDREWYNRGYYGTMSFNSRAVYQRYMGWYDANPVHLAPLEPADEAGRYVAMMGGSAAVLAAAQAAYGQGDDRWAGELANRLVLADAANTVARQLLARVYDIEERLAKYQYVAIGEFHLYGADADLPVPRRMVDLAKKYGLMLHAHADIDAVERLFKQDPKARILWAHAGFADAGQVREMLRKHKNLWADLAFRTDHAPGGKLAPEWRTAFLEFPDRFMVGSDTYIAERWHFVSEHAATARRWLSELPRDVAERIGWKNGEEVLAAAFAKRRAD